MGVRERRRCQDDSRVPGLCKLMAYGSMSENKDEGLGVKVLVCLVDLAGDAFEIARGRCQGGYRM